MIGLSDVEFLLMVMFIGTTVYSIRFCQNAYGQKALAKPQQQSRSR